MYTQKYLIGSVSLEGTDAHRPKWKTFMAFSGYDFSSKFPLLTSTSHDAVVLSATLGMN